MRFLNTIFVFFIIVNISIGQNYFVPEYKITAKTDSAYLNLMQKKDDINTELFKIVDNVLYKNTEAKSVNYLFRVIQSGDEDLLASTFQTDSVTIAIITRNNLSPAILFNLTKKIKSIKNHENWYDEIKYTSNFFDIKNKILQKKVKEFKNYKIKSGDKILEIGSGSLDFAYIIGKKRKNCVIYLNDIDKNALNRMCIGLNVENSFYKKNTKKRNNKYFLIQGSDTSTGTENLVLDKIILRNSFHCFSHKKEMLESIKKSMDSNTVLIIRDKVVLSDTINRKQLLSNHTIEYKLKDDLSNNSVIVEQKIPDNIKHYLLKQDFEDFMNENGFIKIYSKKIKSKSEKNIWIYKFKLK